MAATQSATERCVTCGAPATVTPDPASPWAFPWRCVRGHRGVIAWAHAHPPPVYVRPPADQAQAGLF
jgi:hypothetical protein